MNEWANESVCERVRERGEEERRKRRKKKKKRVVVHVLYTHTISASTGMILVQVLAPTKRLTRNKIE